MVIIQNIWTPGRRLILIYESCWQATDVWPTTLLQLTYTTNMPMPLSEIWHCTWMRYSARGALDYKSSWTSTRKVLPFIMLHYFWEEDFSKLWTESIPWYLLSFVLSNKTYNSVHWTGCNHTPPLFELMNVHQIPSMLICSNSNQTLQQTAINERCIRSKSQSGKYYNFKVAFYNEYFRKKYQCHINVEQTQGAIFVANNLSILSSHFV